MRRTLLFVARRLLQAIPVLLIVAIGVFVLIQLAPGDAVDAYVASIGGASAGFGDELRQQWGLGGSLASRFLTYMLHLVTLDLGYSVAFSQPVATVIAGRIVNTLLLTVSALGVSAGLGMLLGMASGLKPGSARDLGVSTVSLFLNAMPGFFVGLVALIVFALKLSWFPLSGLTTIARFYTGWRHVMDVAWHLVLPVTALGLTYMALYQRLMRAGMIRAAASDYVRMARAKGIAERRIVWRHMARNAILPVLTMLALQSSNILGGSVVIETIFAIPGFGRLAYEAVTQRDLTLLVGVILSGTLVVIAANILIDLAYGWLDPRIEIGARRAG